MSYTYGTKGAPAVGQGVPGLPARGLPAQSTYTRIVTAGSGTIVPPADAKFMRVAVIGPGGSGRDFCGAGGGGCAATKIVPAAVVRYTCGAAVLYNPSTNPNGEGISSSATFPGYNLVATSGKTAIFNVNFGRQYAGAGGVGSGGDYNFSGGLGSNNRGVGSGGAGGGGGAGPLGNGFDYDAAQPLASAGWGVGGGAFSGSSGVDGSNSGGGGAGAAGGGTSPAPNAIFGTTPPSAFVGGVMGGGGGSDGATGSYVLGGVGGIVVEWFY